MCIIILLVQSISTVAGYIHSLFLERKFDPSVLSVKSRYQLQVLNIWLDIFKQ